MRASRSEARLCARPHVSQTWISNVQKYSGGLDQPDVEGGGESLIDLTAVIKTLWRGKWILILSTGAGLALGLLATVMRTDTYFAEAQVLIDPSANQIVDIRSALDNRAVNDSLVSSEIQVIRSNRVLGRVVDDLGLDESPIFVGRLRGDDGGFGPGDVLALVEGAAARLLGRADDGPTVEPDAAALAERDRRVAIANLAGRLRVWPIGSSYVIAIGANAGDPQLAARLANAVAEAYLALEREEKLGSITAAARWLSEQLTELETQVRASADAVDAFRVETGLTDEGKIEQTSLQVNRLRRSLAQARQTETELEDRLFRARSGIDGAALDAADLAGLESQLAAVGRRIETLEASVATAEADLAGLVRSQARLEQLERQAEADRNLYERFLEETKEVDAVGTFQQADARIVADALPPLSPTGPGAKLVLAFATILGAGVGVGLIAVRELLRTAFRSRDELQAFAGLPVLASLPRLRGARGPRQVLERVRKNPSGELAERVRALRASLSGRQAGAAGGSVVVITSSVNDEGKSALSLLLAWSARCANRRVLLIDCDLRRTGLTTALGLSPDADFGEVLAGSVSPREALVVDPTLGVPVIGALPFADGLTPDLLEGRRVGELLDALRREYDLVLIDTPPLAPVTDAALLGRHADTVLFCVRWMRTSRSHVADALRTLRLFGAGRIELALNMVNRPEQANYTYVPRSAGKFGDAGAT